MIVSVVSFVVLIGKPIYSSAKNTATMTAELKMLNENLKNFDSKNEEFHRSILKKTEEHDKKIYNHETRLQMIEHEHDREDVGYHER